MQAQFRVGGKTLAVSLALVVSLIAGQQAAAQNLTQQNVIVVVMDGVRYSETFGDPTHANIPRLWKSLRPLGTISTAFYNRGQTVTAGAHGSLLTGNDHWLDQSEVGPPYPRTFTPTLFEYLRASTGLAQDRVWLIANHVRSLQGTASSLHPAYGADYGATWLLGNASDAQMMKQVSALMDQRHPIFLLINLHQTDKVAHEGDYQAYLNHIRIDDQLVYQLWQKINRNSFYRGHTTLVVLTDHGRHLDDWTDHGDCCEGCQHLTFLALGPNIRRGYVSTVERSIRDLGPTLGAILGVPMPYENDASIMHEILVLDSPDDPVAEPSLPSLELEAVTLGSDLVPRDTFAPGERGVISLQMTNLGATPATVYQGVSAWNACCPGIAGIALNNSPVVVGAGETTTLVFSFQTPPAAPAGPLTYTLSGRGLDGNGQIVEGTTTLQVTIQP
jgi:hypothetical protein